MGVLRGEAWEEEDEKSESDKNEFVIIVSASLSSALGVESRGRALEEDGELSGA